MCACVYICIYLYALLHALAIFLLVHALTPTPTPHRHPSPAHFTLTPSLAVVIPQVQTRADKDGTTFQEALVGPKMIWE